MQSPAGPRVSCYTSYTINSVFGRQGRGHWHWLGWLRFTPLLLLAALWLPSLAQAQRVALVIGNSNYTVESKLPNPVNDARLMASTLRGLGFTVEELNNLAKRDMELAIARFVRQSSGADSAVLYYAGHGAQPLNGGRNYLLPIDARIEGDDTLETDGIVADRIVEQMERQAKPAKLRLVVLDACRNNRLAGKARSSVRGLARMTPGDDYTLIAFSTNDQDVALDGTGSNSPYAQALANHLGRAKDTPLRRIFELTAEDVRRATNQKQKPRTYGDLDSRALLDGTLVASVRVEPVPNTRPAQPAGPSAAEIEQQAWEAAQRSGSEAAYRAYLAEYPQGRFASAARVAMAGLAPRPNPVQPPAPQSATAQLALVPGDTLSKINSSGRVTLGVRASSGALSFDQGGGRYGGYHVEICQRMVANIERLFNKKIEIQYQLVTSQNRLPLVQNGTVDIECGSTTNNASRQNIVTFALTTFVEETRFLVKANSGINRISDLANRNVVTTAGTTSVQTLRKHRNASSLDFKELFGKDHADSFALLESGRADAFVMDSLILGGNVKNFRNPEEFRIVGEALAAEPIGIMFRKDDFAMKKLADETIRGLIKSGELAAIYDNWITRLTGVSANSSTRAAWASPNDKPFEQY